MKSMALLFKTSRPVHLISLFLLGLLIIAAVVCGSRGNSYGAARVADDANQQTETVSANEEIPKRANLVFKDANVITMTGETILKNKSVFVSNGVITAIGDFEQTGVCP